MSVLHRVDYKKLTLVLTCSLITLLFFVFAFYSYPVPAGDSQFFIVPAVEFAKEGILSSPLFPSEWAIDSVIDSSGARRFLFYPPLFPLVTSYLMPAATPQGAFFSLALMNSVVIWLSALLFYRVTTHRRPLLNWSKVFLIVLALLALASSLGETGRPEVLARIWVVLAALAAFYASKKYDWAYYGLLFGFLFATHPAGGIFSLLLLGILFGFRYRFQDIVLRGAAVTLITFLVSVSIIALGPFSVQETIGGTFTNAVVVSYAPSLGTSQWFSLSNLLTYYVFSPVAPFYGFVLLLLVASGIFFFRRYRSCFASLYISLISALILIALFSTVAYSAGHALFYASLFASIIFALFIRYFLEIGASGKIAVVLLFLLVATGIIRSSLLFPFSLKQGVALDDVRARFTEVARGSDHDSSFGVTGSFWSLSENYGRMYIYEWPSVPRDGTAFIFFQQRYSGMLEPPIINGCDLKQDVFSREVPRFLGVSLGSTMPGYGYAFYQCDSS